MGRGRFEPLLTSRSSLNFTTFSTTSNCAYIQGLFTYFWKCNIFLQNQIQSCLKLSIKYTYFLMVETNSVHPYTPTSKTIFLHCVGLLAVRRTMNVLFEFFMECSFLPSTGAPIIPQEIVWKYICSRAWDYQIWHQQRTWMSRVQELLVSRNRLKIHLFKAIGWSFPKNRIRGKLQSTQSNKWSTV